MIILTILGWIVFGLIVGFIARALVPGKDNIGILPTIALGILATNLAVGLIAALWVLRATAPETGIGVAPAAADPHRA